MVVLGVNVRCLAQHSNALSTSQGVLEDQQQMHTPYAAMVRIHILRTVMVGS